MNSTQKGLVLVYGATGRTGYHIANRLVSLGYPVRIFVRSKQKASALYKQRQISFQKIVQGKIQSDSDMDEAFKPSPYFGNVKYAISALGATKRNQSQKAIIKSCKKNNIEKYYLISAAYVDSGWNPITVLLNTIGSNMMYEKSKAQNYLRDSGLNYVILRPTTLVGEYADQALTPYRATQGFVSSGNITRYTLAKVVTDCLQCTDQPLKLTFECSAVKSSQNEQKSFTALKADNKKSMINTHHRIAKFVYWFAIIYILWAIKSFFFSSEQL